MLDILDTPDTRDTLEGREASPDGARAPFFLWVHYQDPHGPYKPPAGLRERYLAPARAASDGRRELEKLDGWRGLGGIPAYQFIAPEREAGWYRAGYAGEIRHVDDELGRLLDALDRTGRLATTLVVFAADHGEGLGERDYWFAHGEYLDDPAVHVPLILRGPGIAPGVRDEPVSLVDVFATVSEFLALPDRAESDGRAPGIDLLSTRTADRSRAVYASTNKSAASRPRRAIVADGWKLVRDGGGATRAPSSSPHPGKSTLMILASGTNGSKCDWPVKSSRAI
jgi:arylsulfatase A-like enzyme